LNVGPQIHGSLPWREMRLLGVQPKDILDFSATVNPYDIPEGVHECINSLDLSYYPDPEHFMAKKELSKFHHLPMEWFGVFAGLTEVIYSLPRLFAKPLVCAPTYGDYFKAFATHNIPIGIYEFKSKKNVVTQDYFRISNFFDLLILCNPNNPCGRYFSPSQIEQLCIRYPNATICIDESYQELASGCESVLPLCTRYSNLLVLKSLTKPFGVGGVRMGYGVSSGSILQKLQELMVPWNVSTIAQHMIPEIFAHYIDYYEQWQCIQHEKHKLIKALKGVGAQIQSSSTPFFLLEVPSASFLRQKLLQDHRIHVRDCTSFGMPQHVRIMPQTQAKNNIFIQVLQNYCFNLPSENTITSERFK
jgi:histidinol-phosphate aminotransferase